MLFRSLAEEFLLAQGWADARQIKNWRKEAVQKVEEAVTLVQHEPAPDPYKEHWSALATDHLREGNADA